MNQPQATPLLSRIRADVQAAHAYKVQDATGLVKLDAMENPYSLPPELQAALGARLGALALNRYPAQRVEDLKKALARATDLPLGYSLMLGNGSDELISLLAMACDKPGARVLAPEPGFVMYGLSAQWQGMEFVGVPLRPDFALDEPAMLAAIAQYQPAITYIAYPNNPTANLWSLTAIRSVIAAAGQIGGLVVMDEAYQPFSSHSWIDEIRSKPTQNAHVLLMRTLSKFGLAGVRIGYLMGPAALIEQINKVRPPYNVSVLNAECALFALEHAEIFAQQAQKLRGQRAMVFKKLQLLGGGVTPYPSEANMMLLRVAEGRAEMVFESLRAKGVLVKNVSTMHPLLRDCLRITIGTADENAQMVSALKASL
ncbi:MAG: histidinol-phosphate transaminase [Burkholderiaceae bacterium]